MYQSILERLLFLHHESLPILPCLQAPSGLVCLLLSFSCFLRLCSCAPRHCLRRSSPPVHSPFPFVSLFPFFSSSFLLLLLLLLSLSPVLRFASACASELWLGPGRADASRHSILEPYFFIPRPHAGSEYDLRVCKPEAERPESTLFPFLLPLPPSFSSS